MTWALWFNFIILFSTAKLAVTAIDIRSSSLAISSRARVPRAEVVDLNRLITRRSFGPKRNVQMVSSGVSNINDDRMLGGRVRDDSEKGKRSVLKNTQPRLQLDAIDLFICKGLDLGQPLLSR